MWCLERGSTITKGTSDRACEVVSHQQRRNAAGARPTISSVLPRQAYASILFIIFSQYFSDALFEAVEIPLPLIADDGAQQRIDVTDGIQNIA